MSQRYPFGPGFRRGSPETSELAAKTVAGAAPSYEAACLSYVTEAPITADEAHARLQRERRAKVPLYSIRPRFSALRAKGLIKDSGERRAPRGGCKAVVWALTSEEERALAAAQRAAEAEHPGSMAQ